MEEKENLQDEVLEEKVESTESAETQDKAEEKSIPIIFAIFISPF